MRHLKKIELLNKSKQKLSFTSYGQELQHFLFIILLKKNILTHMLET